MNFFNSRIVTKSISLEDAVKKAQEPKAAPRSLEEIIASAKQMKTASTQAETKTASVEAPKAEAKVEVKAETAPAVTVKVATEMSAPKAKAPAQAPKAPAKPAEKPTKAAASGKHTVKLAAELDFRNWEAQAVSDAWKQHGSVQQCMSNVAGKASDGKAYCELLRVAASEADKVIKTASAKKEVKVAAPIYKKIAKLTSQEQSFLREFFKKIYGEEYVTAMLGDY